MCFFKKSRQGAARCKSAWAAAEQHQNELFRKVKEAVPIEQNEHRSIRRSPSPTSGGRTVKRPQAAKTEGSRTLASQRQPSKGESSTPPPKPPKPNLFMRIVAGFFKLIAACICLGVMAVSVVAVLVSQYVVNVTANDNLDLVNLKLAQTSTIMAQDHDTGEWVEYASLHDTNDRVWVDLSEIETSPYLKWAFICTEDKDFYEHHGVSIKRTIAAFVNEYTPIKLFSSRQGASTLEQQLVKNITNDDKQDAMRKIREIFRAWGLDNRYDKDTILEAYLNTISLTGNIGGVKAGAIQYFGKSDLAELSAAECASIAAITKSPSQYDPSKNPQEHLRRRNQMLKNMWEQGKLTQAEYQDAINTPLTLVEETQDTVNASGISSYFTDAVYTTLKKQLVEELGYTEQEAHNEIYDGGLRIYATVDPYMQSELETLMLNRDDAIAWGWREQEYELGSKSVDDAMQEENVVLNEDGTLKTTQSNDGTVYYYKKVHTQVGVVTMDYEGAVKALVGGLGEKTTSLSLNRAVDVAKQTGSTMKPIAAYALGVDMGWINYSTNLVDQGVGYLLKKNYESAYPQYKEKLFALNAPEVAANPGIWRDWPSNYNTNTGHGERTVNINYAIAQSLNTIAVQVGQLVGADTMYSFAKDTLGMNHLTPNDASLAPIVLGSQQEGATPMELAGAYQMFGNGGEYVTPHLYTRVERAATGEVLIDNTLNIVHTQAIQENTSVIMNRLLQGVLGSGGTAGGMKPSGKMEAAAKTGTTSDNKDFTFVGLTPYYVTSMWWGYDTPYDMYSMGIKNAKDIQKVWKRYMETVQEGLEYKAFPTSEDVRTAAFCTESGELAGANCPSRQTGYYTSDNMPGHCALHP